MKKSSASGSTHGVSSPGSQRSFEKKLDFSAFTTGVTIPVVSRQVFLSNLSKHLSREAIQVAVFVQDRMYQAYIRNIASPGKNDCVMFLWTKPLAQRIQSMFYDVFTMLKIDRKKRRKAVFDTLIISCGDRLDEFKLDFSRIMNGSQPASESTNNVLTLDKTEAEPEEWALMTRTPKLKSSKGEILPCRKRLQNHPEHHIEKIQKPMPSSSETRTSSLHVSNQKQNNNISFEGTFSVKEPDIIIDGYEESLQCLLSLLDELDIRERMILQLRFGLDGRRPKTLDEISQLIHRTRERVRQLQNQGLAKLRIKLQAELGGSEVIIKCYWVIMKDGQKIRFEDGQEYRTFIREHQNDILRTEVEVKQSPSFDIHTDI